MTWKLAREGSHLILNPRNQIVAVAMNGASTYDGDGEWLPTELTPDDINANVRLIAAAPELYEAAKAAYDETDSHTKDCKGNFAFDTAGALTIAGCTCFLGRLSAAIAKATHPASVGAAEPDAS